MHWKSSICSTSSPTWSLRYRSVLFIRAGAGLITGYKGGTFQSRSRSARQLARLAFGQGELSPVAGEVRGHLLAEPSEEDVRCACSEHPSLILGQAIRHHRREPTASDGTTHAESPAAPNDGPVRLLGPDPRFGRHRVHVRKSHGSSTSLPSLDYADKAGLHQGVPTAFKKTTRPPKRSSRRLPSRLLCSLVHAWYLFASSRIPKA